LTISVSNEQEYLNLKDLSSNGVYINDDRLGRGSKVLLRSGDKIGFAKTGGSYIIRYTVDLKDSPLPATRAFFDDYILGSQLGSGHYAIVKEARSRSNGDVVAVKIFHPNKKGFNKNEDAKLQQEMDLLLSINHPNIVKFIARYVEPINEYAVNTYLVLEKMNSGELFQRIVTKSKLRQDESQAFFKQILSGLIYLHENDIIHRDIKPENILLDITPNTPDNKGQTGPWDENEYDIRVKIADFGLAKFIGELKFTNTLCGTPAYVAPEILNNHRNYSTKVDIWLAGVLLYVCLCGFPPFSDELAPPSMREQIITGKFAFYTPYWDDIHDSALDLISNMLLVDANDRFDANQTAQHYWFSDQTPDCVKDNSSIITSLGDSMITNSIPRTQSSSQPISLKERFDSKLII
jgi:serine/threonine-protein kinase Chk2